MKKVTVWLSDDEHTLLKEYCAKGGRSMYSVLKEGTIHILQGGSVVSKSPAISELGETPFTPPLSSTKSPSLPAPSPPQISPKLQKFEERFAFLEKEVDKLTGYEQLWREVSELKAKVGELSGLVLGLTKIEELEKKLDKKTVETVSGVLEDLGFGRIKERL